MDQKSSSLRPKDFGYPARSTETGRSLSRSRIGGRLVVENTQLFSKVYGCLAAGAIGDQLGRPAEGWNYRDIDEKKGRLTDPMGKDRPHWRGRFGF